MSLNHWSQRWLATVGLLLIVLTGSCTYMFLSESFNYTYNFNSNSDPNPKELKELTANETMNRVRLLVNPTQLYLSQHHADLRETPVQDELRRLITAEGLHLQYAQLDGSISYSSDPTTSSANENVNSTLQYYLTPSTQGGGMLQIAFPVMDETSHIQVGNAIYALPTEQIIPPPQSNHLLPYFLVLVGLPSLLLFLLLISMRSRLRHHVIMPIRQLKSHAEAILKGNYEEKTTANTYMNEMGDLFVMFDQMRIEILHLHMQRLRQEKAQKELISNISHEIKTPITTVKAYADAILEGVCSDTESMLEYIEVMRTHTDKMARMVEDLLLVALQDLGQITVEPREQYSRGVLHKILKPIGHYVQAAGLNFAEPGEIPNVLIKIDEVRIEQVISNLVMNAVKHTSSGDTIRIGTELSLGMLRVTIADTGRGILPQDMPFIFERYFKGNAYGHESSSPTSQAGSGLGLSICKSIVEAHGGTISFMSKPNQGTVFYFTLPLQ